MALRETICFWGTGVLDPRNDKHGGAMKRSTVAGTTKNRSAGRKGVGVMVVATMRRRNSSSHGHCGPIIPLFLSLRQPQKLSIKSSVERSHGLSTDNRRRLSCRAKNGNEDDKDGDNVFDENGRDRNGFDKNGRDRFGRDKYGLDEDGLDRLGIPGDAILDFPIIEPEYHSYIDPNTGEPSPTYGVRNPLPNAAFWGDDLAQIQKSSPTSAAVEKSARSSFVGDEVRDVDAAPIDSDTPPKRRKRAGGKRKKKEKLPAESEEAQSDELSEEELANIAQLKSLRDKFRAEEEGGEYKSIAQVIKESEADQKVEEVDVTVPKNGEEEEDVSLGKIYGPNGSGNRGYALVSRNNVDTDDSETGKALTNDELWWNWQKPPPNEKPWSAWQKRAGDCDTVMASAMAETGQIKLFGEKPTIAEATLARARKRVFYNERMEAEESRKNDIGALAYYKEWVKAYKKDTSKEAVQKHFEKTGEEVGIQLLDMFSYQTDKEYRIMQGTDIRIRRDPLTMRMRPDQIKQVWGGDPVYPTINYEQDPNSVEDYRNENLHEPIPDILEMLRESGRLITQAEVKAMLEREKIEEDELGINDGLSGAVDIGEEDEDELDEDEDEDELDFEEQTEGQIMLVDSSTASKNSSPNKLAIFELDEVVDVGDDGASDDEVKDVLMGVVEDKMEDVKLIEVDEDEVKDVNLIIEEDNET